MHDSLPVSQCVHVSYLCSRRSAGTGRNISLRTDANYCVVVHKDHTYSMCFSPSRCSGAKTKENRKPIKMIIAKTFFVLFLFETGLKVGGGELKV